MSPRHSGARRWRLHSNARWISVSTIEQQGASLLLLQSVVGNLLQIASHRCAPAGSLRRQSTTNLQYGVIPAAL